MNQILSTQNNKNKDGKKNNKTRNYQSNNDIMKKAMIVFSILLILFGLTLATIKIVQMISSREKSGTIGELNAPQISVEKKDDGSSVAIKIAYDGEIANVKYWWNEDTTNIMEKNYNVKEFVEKIPEENNNTLHIEVTTKDGRTNKVDEEITRDLTIQWNQIPESDYMEIVVDSINTISKLEYYWDDEQPMTVPATEENQKKLVTTIPLKRGINTLHTVVTDSEGNTTKREQTLYCVKEPEIDVVVSLDQELIIITVTHDMGFKKIEFDINGSKMIYDESHASYNAETSEIIYRKKLKLDSQNKVSIKVDAYSNEVINLETEETTHATYNKTKDFTNDLNTEEE